MRASPPHTIVVVCPEKVAADLVHGVLDCRGVGGIRLKPCDVIEARMMGRTVKDARILSVRARHIIVVAGCDKKVCITYARV